MIIKYRTELPISECIHNIMEFPHRYKCKWKTTLYYHAEMDEFSELYITFLGGRFRRGPVRTEFFVEFLDDGTHTNICLHFIRDLLFQHSCMTAYSDIDLFMQQKASATRTEIDFLAT